MGLEFEDERSSIYDTMPFRFIARRKNYIWLGWRSQAPAAVLVSCL